MDMGKLLEKVSDHLGVRRAFGTAYERDGMLIIPVAMVAGGGGAHTARTRRGDPAVRSESPPEPEAAADNPAPPDSGRMDVGGGFGGLVLPAGVYVVKGDRVRWVPAVDVTIVVLAALGLVRVLTRPWTRRRK